MKGRGGLHVYSLLSVLGMPKLETGHVQGGDVGTLHWTAKNTRNAAFLFLASPLYAY